MSRTLVYNAAMVSNYNSLLNRYFLGVCLLLFSKALLAQQFSGTITDSSHKIVNDCYVLLLNANTNEVIEYTMPNAKGEYLMNVGGLNSQDLKLKCQGLGYDTASKSISLSSDISVYKNDFVLAIKEQHLDEVVVISERIAINIKNDTIIYDVSKFKRADDRKIINVLKNMPGINVDERTGLIQFKGKPIETILLDGDDLFGKGYSVGARNISSDMVEKVEAIEDYQENKLKKGLTRSDNVVLNLKFKKNKFKLSGEGSAGFGRDNHLVNVNSINLSSNIKGFGVFNANNISMNQTSFNQETYRNENQEEIENYSTDMFRESSVTQGNVFERSYVNNLKFGTYNNLFRISDKLLLKNNIALFGDSQRFSFVSANDFNANGERIRTSNETSNRSKPFNLAISNSIEYELSNSSQIQYTGRIVRNTNSFTQENIQNGSMSFQTEIGRSKLYYQQFLRYTNKLSSKSLLEFTAYHSNDEHKQELSLVGQEPIISNGQLFDEEAIKTQRSIAGGNISYLRKIGSFDFQLGLHHRRDKEDFDVFAGNEFNDLYYTNISSSAIGELNYRKRKKVRISGRLEVGHSDRSLGNTQYGALQEQNDLFINSSVKLKLKVSDQSVMSLSLGNKNETSSNYYLLSNPLLIDSRTIIKSEPSLDFRRSWRGSASFATYDLLKQSNFSLLATYSEERNAFLARQDINEDVSIITYFQNPLTKKDINISASSAFFMDFINNKVSLNANANFNRFFNSINNGATTEVFSSIYNFNIDLNSAFKGFFNYKSSFGITYVENKQDNIPAITNNTITAGLETIFKFSEKMLCKIDNELLLPKGSSINSNQLFVDLSFNRFEKKVEYFVLARNLLNKRSFKQISTTEFSTSVFSNNLFDRYIVLGINYSF
ncbi:hypothetical protein ACFQ1M_01230 [Sungkyunkwania multivorans]|uniref:Outer membrane protein beta-barrel domain-containing protein n=1 Tax=Sungkyunkwania multivorans TaxID=1173618 RepID=A0ABW3CU67_9FLAO